VALPRIRPEFALLVGDPPASAAGLPPTNGSTRDGSGGGRCDPPSHRSANATDSQLSRVLGGLAGERVDGGAVWSRPDGSVLVLLRHDVLLAYRLARRLGIDTRLATDVNHPGLAALALGDLVPGQPSVMIVVYSDWASAEEARGGPG
jgi:hypothetical protein